MSPNWVEDYNTGRRSSRNHKRSGDHKLNGFDHHPTGSQTPGNIHHLFFSVPDSFYTQFSVNYSGSPPSVSLSLPAMASAASNASFFTLQKSHFSSLPFISSSKTLKPLNLVSKSPFPILKTHNSKPMTTKCLPSDPSIPAPLSLSKTLKTRLAEGETLYGIFLLSFSPPLAEIIGLSGYDFAVVDMEHGHGGISDALPCLYALAATNTPAILRLPELDPTWAKKALDLGPQGIMFPMIENQKSAKKAVSYCRFPPDGIRGSAHTVVRASGYGIDDGYVTNYADDLLIMCQVETEEGVKKIEEIAAVDGVDCIQMGPLDLSASFGYLWDPGNKKVREVLKSAEKAVLGMKKREAYLAGFAMPHDSPQELRTRGYHMVSGTVDVGLFRAAAVEDVKKFKSFKSPGSEEEEKEGDEDKYWSE